MKKKGGGGESGYRDAQSEGEETWGEMAIYEHLRLLEARFQGLDLIDRVPEELWMGIHDILQEAVIKTIPNKKKKKPSLRKRNTKRQNGCLRRPYK